MGTGREVAFLGPTEVEEEEVVSFVVRVVFDEVGSEKVVMRCLHMGLNLGEDVLF